LFTLHERILVESLGICLQLARGSSLGLQVFVAILEFLIWLTPIVIEQVAPDRDEAADQPQVAVALDEAGVASDGVAETSEGQDRVDLPGVEGRWVLHAESVVGALTGADRRIQLLHLIVGDFTQELSRGIRVDFSEAVLELDGVAVAG
jgi:hypothetical protein